MPFNFPENMIYAIDIDDCAAESKQCHAKTILDINNSQLID